ncbi:unnamed protein product [Camellia sinensis]
MVVDTTVLGLLREEAEKKPYIASMGVWRFPTANDFGPEIIPASAKEFLIKAYLFNDYWEDIGTIRSFFEANLALTAHSRVVGIRSRIYSNVHLKDTVMPGADDYETDAEIAAMLAEGRVPIGIGDCIIDKNARIGKNVGIQEADRSSEGFYIRSEITKVARMLAAKPAELGEEACCVMALLDGGMLRRHKSWLKVEPPTIVVATLGSLCQMIDKKILKLDSMQVLVIDEMHQFPSTNDSYLTAFSKNGPRFADGTFVYMYSLLGFSSICRLLYYLHTKSYFQQDDVVHVHVNPVEPMPSRLHHRFVMCGKNERHQTLLSLLRGDAPHSAIISVSVQSEKSKKAGHAPPTTLLIDLLKTSLPGCFDILMLEEDMNFNLRAASLSVNTVQLMDARLKNEGLIQLVQVYNLFFDQSCH